MKFWDLTAKFSLILRPLFHAINIMILGFLEQSNLPLAKQILVNAFVDKIIVLLCEIDLAQSVNITLQAITGIVLPGQAW